MVEWFAGKSAFLFKEYHSKMSQRKNSSSSIQIKNRTTQRTKAIILFGMSVHKKNKAIDNLLFIQISFLSRAIFNGLKFLKI